MISCLRNSITNNPEPPTATPIAANPVPIIVRPAPHATAPSPSKAIAPAKPNSVGTTGVNINPANPNTVNAPANANNAIPTPSRLI